MSDEEYVPAERELGEVTWSPKTSGGEKSCLDLYGEYVKERRTVTELALSHRLTSKDIRQRVKWAAMRLRSEMKDNEVVRQMSDSYLMGHLDVLEAELEHCEKDSVRATLLKEIRLTFKDLAEVRGVRDFQSGKSGEGKIVINMPNLHRGEGVEVVAEQNNKEY